jgi:hypothetical protein
MRPLTRALTIAATVVLPGTADGQRFSGVVRNAATGEAVLGALVTISAGDSTLSRDFSKSGGAFRVTATPGAQVLQARRIGYRPFVLNIARAVDGADISQMIVDLTPVPALLDTSVSRARGAETLDALIADGSRCPHTDAAAEAMELWEQAQIGFVSTVAVRLSNPPTMTAFRYAQRARDGNVFDHTVRAVGGTALGTFAAQRTAAEFASLGYAGVAGESLVFYGLDVNTLLDRTFLLTHCLSVARPDALQPGRVGINFAPAPGREALIEVSGTVWLDRSPLALASMEFRYEGVSSRARAAATGGSIAFRTTENGTPIIDRWQLRLLEGIARKPRATNTTRITRDMLEIAPGAPLSLTIEGAELKGVQWADGATMTRTFSSVQGTVVLADGRAKAGMHVELLSSPYHGVTDSAGRFAIPDVIAGPYTLIAYDTTWSSFGQLERVDQRITADGSTPTTVSLRVPTFDPNATSRCDATFPGRGPLAVEIRPSDPRFAAIRPLLGAVGATVDVSVERDGWTRNAPLRHQTTLGATVRLCGLFPGDVTVKVTAADGRRGEKTMPLSADRVTSVGIPVR